jgi:hypothetical protein
MFFFIILFTGNFCEVPEGLQLWPIVKFSKNIFFFINTYNYCGLPHYFALEFFKIVSQPEPQNQRIPAIPAPTQETEYSRKEKVCV